MSHRASYLTHDAVARDQIDWTPEWSHRGRGIATYAAIRQLGKRGVAELIERTCQYAHRLVTRIGALPGTGRDGPLEPLLQLQTASFGLALLTASGLLPWRPCGPIGRTRAEDGPSTGGP
jgi:glutamate/tyrosine decarboxylase-like PLP-dependent enzyme